MARSLPILVLAACLFISTLAASAARAQWTHDPAAAGPGVSAPGEGAYGNETCSDNAGGVFTMFCDNEDYANIYVQHTSAAGLSLWGTYGIKVSTLGGTPHAIIPDGYGGAICVWAAGASNFHIYTQRITAAGATAWTAGGVLVCNAANNEDNPALVSDGYGGAYFAWQDARVSPGTYDIYAQHVAYNGYPQWTANGVVVCNAAGTQLLPQIISDGGTGMFISWADGRGSNQAPYVQRLNYFGGVVSGWPTNGLALDTGITADAYYPTMIPDGLGGAIVAWYDWRTGNSDVFIQRVTAAGTVLWTANGVDLTNLGGDQVYPALVGDGASGAVVTWQDGRNGTQDIYVQRVNAFGTPQWTTNGSPVCQAAGNQTYPQLASDGSGGAILAWDDERNAVYNYVYAQHVLATGANKWTADGIAVTTLAGDNSIPWVVTDGAGGAIVVDQSRPLATGLWDTHLKWIDRFGMLGGAAPTIVSVEDVPNDQGGVVQIRWTPSWLDAEPANPLSYYWIYRQVPQAQAQAALERGAARLLAAGEAPKPGERALRMTTQGASIYYWDYLNTCNAEGQDGYSFIAGTRSDSIAGSNPLTLFMIEARYASVVGEYWDSAPDSGYSADNLAPLAPAPFTGTYAKGSTAMSWGANTESDFAGYRLYRGASAGFTPGPANLVAAMNGTSYTDAPGQAYDYKLCAVDIHGNASAYALLQPAGTTDVAPLGAYALALAAPAPNPAGGRAAFAYTLPRAGAARLALYDAAGRCVRVLADGEQGAGEHRVAVALSDAGGNALPAGLYVVRLEAAGRTLARRLAVVR